MLFHEWTRERLRAAAAHTLAVLPTGATEQHGPHLPVGTDWLVVQQVARAAAAEAAAQIPIVVAPALPFGSSHHHFPFGGTLSLSTETYYRVVSELAESLVTDGFRSIFILNGHGGNHEPIQLVARDLALKHPVAVGAASYWNIAWDALVAAGALSEGDLPGHSGAFETALMLALQPELVQEPRPHRAVFAPSDPVRFPEAYRAEVPGAWQKMDGFSDRPDRARAEHGQRYLAAIIAAVAQAFVEFYRNARAALE